MVEAVPVLLIFIPLLPLAGAIVNGIFGWRYSTKWVSWIACSTVFLSMVLSFLSIYGLTQVPEGVRGIESLKTVWIPGGNALTLSGALSQFTVEWAFWLDPLSAVMLFVVTFVGFWIHVYSIGYMHGDRGYARYFSYLNLFMAMMLTLVLGKNLLVLFVGWEGVGLCSYLLIGYFYEEKWASDAGKKAFLVNRIGDLGFVLAIMLIFQVFGTIDIPTLSARALEMFPHGSTLVTAMTLLLFVGATGKSAQIPLYVWLPDAMAGPTPVSALIHAATMVTSGIYMVSRTNVLYQLSPTSMAVVMWIGAATAIFAASIGFFQTDIKKVLAYSTVSQLGYMFLGCGTGAFIAGIFHLMTHAFFKACLFLGSGSVIHALSGEKDIRFMGDLRRHLPHTYRTFLIATLAIAGLPPLAAFFSKDEILWKTFEGGNRWPWIIGLTAAGMTAFYMFRCVFITFFGESRVTEEAKHHLHESPKVMTIPLWVLAAGSIVAGWVGIPAALGGGNQFHHWLSGVIAPIGAGGEGVHEMAGAAAEAAAEHGTAMEYLLMVASVLIALIGIFIAYSLYYRKSDKPALWAEKFRGIYRLILNKYYVDEIYNAVAVQPMLRTCRIFSGFDLAVIDGMVNGTRHFTVGTAYVSARHDNRVVDGLVNLIGRTIQWGSAGFRRAQTGRLENYALIFILGVFLMVCFLLFR